MFASSPTTPMQPISRPHPEVPRSLSPVRIDGPRLHQRLADLASVGALEGGGVARLALTDADRAGRDRVIEWMRELELDVRVDRIGNVVGSRRGREDLLPVVTGSHIDTVQTGGVLDGTLGVLAGLEVIASLRDAGVTTRRPLAVAFFTNEEGARFAPDMMGSAVQQGALDLDRALARSVSTAAASARSWLGSATPAMHRPPSRPTRLSSCTSSRGPCSIAKASRSARSRGSRGSRGPR